MGAIVSFVLIALVLSALGAVLGKRACARTPRRDRLPALLRGGVRHDRLGRLGRLVRVGGCNVAVVALLVVSQVACAQEDCAANYANAQATCQAAADYYLSLVQYDTAVCHAVPASDGGVDFYLKWTYKAQYGGGGGDDYQSHSKCPKPVDPPNQCSGVSAPSGDKWGGNFSDGGSICVAGCSFAFKGKAGSISVGVPGTSTGYSQGTFSPTGESCTASAPLPSNDPPAPCSGKSCYDPNSGKFCSVNDAGVQVCVKGPTNNGDSAPPAQPSGCAVNGASAACAHASSDPAPTPPNPPITDPQAQGTGQGSFSASTPGGGTIGISVGTFQGSSNTAGNGSGTGQTGDGSGNGDDGDGDCTAGKLCNDAYTEAGCGATPATAGDPLLSQMAVEAQRQRCRDIAGDAAIAGSDKGMGGDHTSGEVFSSDDGKSPTFDDSGFLGGGGTCPGLPSTEYQGNEMRLDGGLCAGAPILAGFVLFAAYVIAALVASRLTAGG